MTPEFITSIYRRYRLVFLVAATALIAALLLASIQPSSNSRPTEEQERREMAMLDFALAPAPLRDMALRIAAGDAPEVDALRALGPEIDRSYPNRPRIGETLLTAALRYRNLKAINALLEAGADPHALIDPDSSSSQVVHWTFFYRLLTDRGLLIEAEDRRDSTFSNEALSLYLKHGGDPNHYPPENAAPPLGATLDGNLTGFEMLLDAGADPWSRNIAGNPWLMDLAVYSGKIATPYIHRLAERGFYDDITDDQADKILQSANRRLKTATDLGEAAPARAYYGDLGDNAFAIKLLIERSGREVPRDSEVYRRLYIDRRLGE
ncbi:hypothetical protein ABFT80_14590 [Mesorhizobium sp. SB112]|uniref:ankyrin repeat domain-containing protein n=2 Tax=Pseudomonadota TaxID=1224 RepID=UPI003265B06A